VKLLWWLALAWLTVEGAVALVAGVVAGSIAFVGFGLDAGSIAFVGFGLDLAIEDFCGPSTTSSPWEDEVADRVHGRAYDASDT
jgi:hypothetical protein